MKKILLAIIILFVGIAAHAQDDTTPTSDTTRIKMKNSTITITKEKNEKEDDSDSKDDKYKDEGRESYHHHHSDWAHFSVHLGAHGYMAPDYEISLPAELQTMELDYLASRTFGFTFVHHGLHIVKNRLFIRPGLGITWNRYGFKNDINISTGSDTTQFTINESIDYDRYQLRETYLEIPLILGTRIGKLKRPLAIQAGVVGGLKIGSRVKEKYRVDGAKVKNKIKDDFNINPFKLDAIARIGIDGFGIFARYSLTTLFEENKAPELNAFSVGLTIGGF